MSLRENFGKRLVELRRAYGITQAQLAEKIGVSVEFISLMERGINSPSFDTLEKLASAIEIEVYELFLFEGADKVNELRSNKRISKEN
ncbi:helix-turn-helix transcriptional regulator (plasmid) [Geobacillus stearothermophilus]|nr:helix-turn-helix transcriptional regulator [Geobacillus stearothermophilus]